MFERWAIKRMKEKERCKVERSMTCLPLTNDPICRACYEGAGSPFGGAATPYGATESPRKKQSGPGIE